MTYFPQKKTYDYDELFEKKGTGLAPGSAFRVIGLSVLAAALIAYGLSYYFFVRHVPFSVRAQVSPRTSLIGDTVRCDITVTADRDDEYQLIVPDKVFSGFTVRGTDSFEGGFLRKKTLKKTYLLTRYSPGEAEVGQVEASAREEGATGWKTAKSAPISVTFRALLPDERVPDRRAVIEGKYFAGAPKAMGTMPGMGGEEGGGGHAVDGPVRLFIKEKAEPRSVPTIKDMGLTGLAVLIGGILALVLALVVYGTIKAVREKPLPLPHETALARLARLSARTRDERRGKKDERKEKEFCGELYTIMTDYVKAAFGLGAGNITAKEFIALTGVVAALSKEQKEYLKKTASLCDLVKFSGYEPGQGELDGEIKAAIEFVEATKPKKEVTSDK